MRTLALIGRIKVIIKSNQEKNLDFFNILTEAKRKQNKLRKYSRELFPSLAALLASNLTMWLLKTLCSFGWWDDGAEDDDCNDGKKKRTRACHISVSPLVCSNFFRHCLISLILTVTETTSDTIWLRHHIASVRQSKTTWNTNPYRINIFFLCVYFMTASDKTRYPENIKQRGIFFSQNFFVGSDWNM